MYRESREQFSQLLCCIIIPDLLQNDDVCTKLRKNGSHFQEMLVPLRL